MRKRNVVSPLLLALTGGALFGIAQVAPAQPVASPYANVDTRSSRVIIQPRIMLSPAAQNRRVGGATGGGYWQGDDALRQYVFRTRMIYNYYMPDLVNVT